MQDPTGMGESLVVLLITNQRKIKALPAKVKVVTRMELIMLFEQCILRIEQPRVCSEVPAPCLLDKFEVLGNTTKSHTRRVQVNGQDLVVKVVDFLGTPKCGEFSAENLYEYEWNEVRTYYHLRDLHSSDAWQRWHLRHSAGSEAD